jgi:hypothetical protein
MSRKEIVAAMKDTCKFLDAKKVLFERMILALENEDNGNEDVAVDDGYEGAEEEDDVAEEEEEDGDEEEDMETDA